MALNDEAIVIAKYLHVSSVRNYAIRKAIEDNFEALKHSNFWCVVANSTLDIAVIDWCKLFGSYSESTHFKNCKERGITDFNKQVLATANIELTDYKLLHESFLTYRDKSVAHVDIDEWQVLVPYLHNAVEITYISFDVFTANVGIKGLDIRQEFNAQYDATMVAIKTCIN
jgi:hypothetical protein